MIIYTPDFEPFEARVKFVSEKWGAKVELLSSAAKKKVFNPKQLNLFQ